MKKRNVALLLTGLLATGILLFSACHNVLSPSFSGGGQGNVTVSLAAGPSGRTIMPSALDFDFYEFTFTNGDYEETFEKAKSPGGSFSFSVPVGSGYSLNVKAYKVGGETKTLAAEGNSTDFFTVSSSTSVTVKLSGNLKEGENDGTFSYAVQYPAGAQIIRFVLIGKNDEIDLLNGAVEDGSAMANELSLPAGWYGLELDIIDGDKIAYDDDIVVIYSDTTTFYGRDGTPVLFEAKDFKDISGDNGEPCDDWHGFVVPGTDSDNPPSFAVGTLYDTYTDSTGTYTDVLKVEPPEGAYPYATMALTYPVPSNGMYKLSMLVKIENWSPEGVCVSWEKAAENWDTMAGGQDNLSEELEGTWFMVAGDDPAGVYLSAGDQFGLLAQRSVDGGNIGDVGLNNSTIYIRNLRLELDGFPIIDTSVADGHVYGVMVSPASVEITEGQTYQLTAQVFPSDAANKSVSWSSGNTSVATVDANGLVTALAEGSALITVTTADGGKTAASYVTVYAEGWVEPKYIALTFDDGPYPEPNKTAQLLDIFAAHEVHGTFFETGNQVSAHPELTRDVLAGGHDVGNHSLTHSAEYYDVGDGGYNERSVEEYKYELIRTQDIITEVTGGFTPVLFRSPHLYSGGNLLAAAKDIGLPDIFCDDSQDWTGLSAGDIYNNAMNLAKPWGIILFHDWTNTPDAIDDIITDLKSDGYTIVSVSEMLAKRKALYLEPGQIYNDFSAVPADSGFPSDGIKIGVSSISVSPSDISLEMGETWQLSAAVLPTDATHGKVIWYSENNRIATVSSSGLVSAKFKGSTTVRAVADGKMAVINVTVTGASSADPWTVFDYGASDTEYSGGAVGAVGSWDDYSNVLRLSVANPEEGTVAMSYYAPVSGYYTLSMDVWVEKRTYPNVSIFWHGVHGEGWPTLAGGGASVPDGYWVPIGTPGAPVYLSEGDLICLLILNAPNNGSSGFKDAILYIKDLVLEADGDAILDIPSGAFDPETAFDDISLYPSWEVFDPSGGDFEYEGGTSGALGEVVNFTDGFGDTYSNVYKLALPEGEQPIVHTVAMTYVLPYYGNYALSMDVWIEQRDWDDITICWQESSNEWKIIADTGPVTEGEWIHVVTPGSGVYAGGYSLYLLIANAVTEGGVDVLDDDGNPIVNQGLKDAIVYIRDLKLTCDGQTIVSCPSEIVP